MKLAEMTNEQKGGPMTKERLQEIKNRRYDLIAKGKRIAELEATVERLTKSLFKAGEQLDVKEAENQKMAELLDQAPHDVHCALITSFADSIGECDCWKKQADAVLSNEKA